ncbi:MAG TPA: phytanoyl-CoA dioxygenase family protein, partial [Geminicoccaceae bacterium]
MITRQQVESYRENGFVVVEGVLAPDEVSELRRVTDEMVEGARGLTAHTEVYDLEDTHRPDDPRVRRIKFPDRH